MAPAIANPVQLLQEARQCLARGDHEGAAHRARLVLRKARNNLDAHTILSEAQFGQGDYAGARQSALRALKLNPRSAELHCNLALAYQAEGRIDDARRAFDESIRLRPGSDIAVTGKAEMCFMAGEYGEAADLLDPLLKPPTGPTLRAAIVFARVAPRLGQERRAIDLLRLFADDARTPVQYRMNVLRSLGQLHDRLGEYNPAFAAFTQANRLDPARFDPAAHSRLVDQTIALWSRQAIAGLPRSVHRSARPVFIVGMPRSGTTLLEQIIAKHPRGFGGGELTRIAQLAPRLEQARQVRSVGGMNLQTIDRKVIDACAHEYLQYLKSLNAGAERITDKMPVNYGYLGHIALMFPECHVIHCRRDPRDTCLSCYTHNFAQAHAWTNDLQHLGSYYRDYERLMHHWHDVLDLPMLDVQYEELTADPDTWIPRIIEFIELDWDDACLSFFEARRINMTPSVDQVRRPMYTSSVGRWKHYQPHLQPLIEALADAPLRPEAD